jgi:WD40 repeat protein
VLAASALLLGSAVVLAVSNVRIRGERDEKAAALRERQAALKVADENMAVARQNERTAQQRLSESLRLTGQSLVAQGRGTEAVARYREALAVTRSLGGAELGVTLGLLDAYRSVPPALATAQVSRERIVPAFPEPTALLERDGRTVVAGEATGAVLWLDIATGIERGRVKAHGAATRCLAASADGRRVVTGGDDGSIVIWDADARREIARADAAHQRPVRRVVISPRGDVFASAGDDGRVKLWDLATAQARGDFPSHNGPEHVETLAFTPDGDAIISGCHDKRIVVWSWADGQTRATLQAHADCVDDLELTGAKLLVSRSADGVIHTWAPPAAAAAIDAPAFSLHSADRHFRAVACAGDRLFAGGIDGSITSWRLGGDGKSAEPLGTQLGPPAPIAALRVNPDRDVALRVDLNGTMSLVSLGESNEAGVLRGHGAGVLSAVFSADGLLAASASWDGTVRVWDVATQRELRRFGAGDGSTRYWSVTFGPNAESIIAGGDDGHVVAWPLSADAKSPKPLYRIKAQDGLWRTSEPSAAATQPGNPTRPASAIVTSVALSPDGRVLATAGTDATIKLWDARTGSPVRRLVGHAENVRWVTFSPDGTRLVSASYDRQAIVWDVARGAELARLAGAHKNWVNAVAVSPDASYAVTGGRDGLMTLWDLKTFLPIRTTFGHAESVGAVAFSRDGRTIASGGEDRTIRIWDRASGTELHHVVRHAAPVKDVRFSADGSRLLSASLDGTIGVLDLSRPAAHERFAVDCPKAQQALRADRRDAAALHTLGRWFAFRGCDWLAADLLREAEASGAGDVSSLALARAQWRMGRGDAAAQTFKRAIDRREAPAAYLALCAAAAASESAKAPE